MMSRKFMTTSVLLVVGYCVVYHYSDIELKRNRVMNRVLTDILNEEIKDTDGLRSLLKYVSKKKSSWMDYTSKMDDELDLILDLQEKSAFKNTGYASVLFGKYGVNPSLLNADLSEPLAKYQLYRAVNDQISNHIQHLDESTESMSHLHFRLVDRRSEYQINEIHQLDFQFFEKGNFENEVKYFYEIEGEKKRIDQLPLILDYMPKDIQFSQTFKSLVTGETRTFNSRLTP